MDSCGSDIYLYTHTHIHSIYYIYYTYYICRMSQVPRTCSLLWIPWHKVALFPATVLMNASLPAVRLFIPEVNIHMETTWKLKLCFTFSRTFRRFLDLGKIIFSLSNRNKCFSPSLSESPRTEGEPQKPRHPVYIHIFIVILYIYIYLHTYWYIMICTLRDTA